MWLGMNSLWNLPLNSSDFSLHDKLFGDFKLIKVCMSAVSHMSHGQYLWQVQPIKNKTQASWNQYIIIKYFL